MELLYICDLKGEWLDFIYTFSQLLPGLVAGALGRYVLCGVAMTEPTMTKFSDANMRHQVYFVYHFLGNNFKAVGSSLLSI